MVSTVVISVNLMFKACVHPTLDLWNRDMEALYADQRPILCHLNEENWVEVINGTFHITESASKHHGNITCRYTPLKRGSSDWIVTDMDTINITHGDPITSDFFTVRCVGTSNNKTYRNIHSGIYKKETKAHPLPTSAMGFNVLILGLDSVSRMAMERLFLKTYSYFKDTLGGIVLEGYNIVGDGTIHNVLPFLCGKTLNELPEGRRGKPNAKRVDRYPWVWKKYRNIGYMTQYIEDQPEINTFNYYLLGFREQPVHHYMRPFYLKRFGVSRNSTYMEMCLGSKRLHVNALDWVQDFFISYKNHPKFSFIFINSLMHNSFNAYAADADRDLLSFLKSMERQGNMKNTLLILMSDHGPRFQEARRAAQGRLEERMPFMGFWVPPEFKIKYPIALRNLRTNAHRLTTPFDIHETLMDVINYRGVSLGNLSERGISLFREIPPERTCSQAGIATHWCACQELKVLSNNDSVVQMASLKLVSTINVITSGFENVCHRLSMSEIIKARIYIQNENMNRVDNNEVYLSITVRTTPGEGLFEATMKYSTVSGNFTALQQDISRTNAYDSQSRCVLNSNPSLLRFCYCQEP